MPGVAALLDCLPADWRDGLFLGRVETAQGPSPIMVSGGVAYDMSRVAPTLSQLSPVQPSHPPEPDPIPLPHTLAVKGLKYLDPKGSTQLVLELSSAKRGRAVTDQGNDRPVGFGELYP